MKLYIGVLLLLSPMSFLITNSGILPVKLYSECSEQGFPTVLAHKPNNTLQGTHITHNIATQMT